jgi:hypothetical protein
MRNKIIAVNAVIVLIVGLLSFVIVRQAIVAAASNTTQLTERAKRDAQAASARFQFDGLRAERWLGGKASEPAAHDVLSKATASARGDAATVFADAILAAAKKEPFFGGAVPSLVAVIDANGKIIGRNGSTLSRGEDLASAYPALKEAIAKGQSGSDVWVNPGRNDNYLASYAPLRDDKGNPAGAVAIAMTLNDSLSRVSDATTGRGLLLAVVDDKGIRIASNSTNATDNTKAAVTKVGAEVKAAIGQGHSMAVAGDDVIVAAAPLEGFGAGRNAAVVSVAAATLVENAGSLPLPILGVMGLGVVLVIVGGWLLGNYITRPIQMLEEGLLAILNGQSDKRFELDHGELGGLAFRIDQLLNQLMGVEEDNTDDEGRPSNAPTAAHFAEAMSVDQGGGGSDAGLDAAAIQRLAAEPAPQYYARIYGEYIAAKKGLGEKVDHITEQAFASRIQGMETDASQKHGKPVRYHVAQRGREVVLLAVPLP